MSEITKVWFEQAKKLKVDEAIFVRVADKKEQMVYALNKGKYIQGGKKQ